MTQKRYLMLFVAWNLLYFHVFPMHVSWSVLSVNLGMILTPDRGQSKMLILSTNMDKKLLETEFMIAICRQTGDKWQSKTLFPAILDLRLSLVKSIFDCHLSGVILLVYDPQPR